MSTKTEVIVARLFDGSQLVHSIALPRAEERLTLNELVPAGLQGLDFDIPDQAPKSLWTQVHWGSVDYIPLEEWKAEHRLEPEEANLVPRPGGDPLVIARYVEYQRVKEF